MEDVNERMRSDWNERARDDAHYFVAFGRRGQDESEFLATAKLLVTSLEAELKRLLPRDPRARRALEIGCGPGRLMLPLAKHFGEIHGIDISDEMIRLARQRLHDVPNAFPRHAPRSDLSDFADESFDFVYSYAVFQHIPDRETVIRYMMETRRVLRPAGIARLQINGLPETAPRYDTWSGVRIPSDDVARFAREHDFQLLALEGTDTQYMWTTWRKMSAGWSARLPETAEAGSASLRRITNAFSSEPVAPTRGRFSSISLWLERLPLDCDLNSLSVRIGGLEGSVFYLGPQEMDGLQQLNVYLPEGLGTGLLPVEVLWRDRSVCEPATVRTVPPGPPVPRLISVSDGVDLLSGKKIVSGIVKMILEEIEHPEQLEVRLGGQTPEHLEIFCTDPRLPKYEVNFPVPEQVVSGAGKLELRLGKRRFPPVDLEVVRES